MKTRKELKCEMELVRWIMRRRRRIQQRAESSSSSDEWEILLSGREERQLLPRVENYIDLVNRYSDWDFKSHFRLSRTTFEYLNNMLRPDLIRHVPGCPTISTQHQLLITMWKMVSTDSYRFNVGRATAVRAVRRVTNAVFRRAAHFISWPSRERAIHVIRSFQINSGFPNVGVIDGTHIRINAPRSNPTDYINRKGYHSIQLQLVCDNRMFITHCYVGHPGSVHDQRVFRLSEVSTYLDEDDKFPGDSYLLGDVAYELHEHLLTPFRDNGHLTQQQRRYNYVHSSARVTIERCIGMLKGRMRSLLHCLPMSRIDLTAKYVVACCVLHNICLFQEDELRVIAIPIPEHHNVNYVNNIHRERRHAAVLKRNRIMNIIQ